MLQTFPMYSCCCHTPYGVDHTLQLHIKYCNVLRVRFFPVHVTPGNRGAGGELNLGYESCSILPPWFKEGASHTLQYFELLGTHLTVVCFDLFNLIV